jgi:hypothetical protein
VLPLDLHQFLALCLCSSVAIHHLYCYFFKYIETSITNLFSDNLATMNATRFVSVDPHETKKASVTHAEIDVYLRTRTWSFSAPLFQPNPADLPAEQAIHEVIARFILAGSNHFPTQNEIRAMILRIKTDALKRDDLFLFPELNNDGLAQWNHKVRTDFEYFEHPQRHPETTLTVRGLYRKSTNSTAPHFEVTPLERFPDLLLLAHWGNGNEHLNRDAMYRYMKQNLSKSIPKALCMDFIKACPNTKCKDNVTNAQNSKAKRASKVEAGEIPRKERKNAKRPRDHVNDHNKPVKRSRNPRGYECTHSPMSRMHLNNVANQLISAAVAPQMCQPAVGIPGQPAMPGQAAWQMGQGQEYVLDQSNNVLYMFEHPANHDSVNIHNQFGNGDVYNHPLPAGPYQNQHYPDVPENNGPAPYYPQVNAGQPETQPNADIPEPNFPAYYNIPPRVPQWPHVDTGAPFLNFQRPAEPFLPQAGEDQQLAALLIDYNNRHDEYGQVREQPAAFNAFNDVQCHAGQSREQPASFNSYNDHQVSFEQFPAQLGVANAFNTVQDQVGHVQEQFADTKAYNNHQVNFEQSPAQPNASGAFPSGAFSPSGAFPALCLFSLRQLQQCPATNWTITMPKIFDRRGHCCNRGDGEL